MIVPVHREIKSGYTENACAHRDCGRFRSGCRMSAHAPLHGPHVNNPRLLLPARERRAIRDSLMPFRITQPNEAWRGMDGVGRRPVRGQASPCSDCAGRSSDSTSSITLCVFTTDQTEAPLLRMLIEPTDRNGLSSALRLMVDKVTTVPKARLGKRIGKLIDQDVVRLNRALTVFLGLAR